jgi:hypothetical protein
MEQRSRLRDELPRLAYLVLEGEEVVYRHPRLMLVPEAIFAALGERTVQTSAFPQLFTLLHEYGHVILGHTDEIRRWPPMREVLSQPRLDLLEGSRVMELEADKFAAERIARIAAHPVETLVGITFFFALLNTYAQFVELGPGELRTHPSPIERCEAALGHILSDRLELATWRSRARGFMALLDTIPADLDW